MKDDMITLDPLAGGRLNMGVYNVVTGEARTWNYDPETDGPFDEWRERVSEELRSFSSVNDYSTFMETFDEVRYGDGEQLVYTELRQSRWCRLLCRFGLHRGDEYKVRFVDLIDGARQQVLNPHAFLQCACGATPGHWFVRRRKRG